MPVSRPRRKSGAVTSCPKDTSGAELHNPGFLSRGRKRAALTATRASTEHGHKERTLRWWASCRAKEQHADKNAPSRRAERDRATRRPTSDLQKRITAEGLSKPIVAAGIVTGTGLVAATRDGAFPDALAKLHATLSSRQVAVRPSCVPLEQGGELHRQILGRLR
jgi:hypothetical protein